MIKDELEMVLPEFVELLSQAGHVIDLGPLFGHFLNRVKTWLDETGGERFLQLQLESIMRLMILSIISITSTYSFVKNFLIILI